MGKLKMINKTFTFALIQACASAIGSLRDGDLIPEEIMDGGLINITGFAQIDQEGQIRIEADDLYALAHLLEEYERNQGGDPDSGNPDCNKEQIWEENVINGNETVFDYLYDWFHN